MRRYFKGIFFCAAAIVWIAAICLALELYTVVRWRSIERSNPFVFAYKKDGQIWTRVDIDDQGNPSAEQMQGFYETAAGDNRPDRSTDDHLGTLFASLSEEDRASYALLQVVVAAVFDREGKNLGTYVSPDGASALGLLPEDFAMKPFAAMTVATQGAEGISLIQRVMDSGKPETLDYPIERNNTTQRIEMSCFPMKDRAAVVCTWRDVTHLSLTEEKAREKQSEDNPMWKTPFFEYRKNAHLTTKWFTNNLGFRDDDVALPKPAGVFRIACVGGSTTEEGLSNETTYPNLLEKNLRQEFNNRAAIEVVNCGVIGLDSFGERKRTLDFARTQPDLVIELNGVNDICHGLFPQWEAAMKPWQKVLRRSRFVDRYVNCLLRPSNDAVARQFDERTFRNLSLMAEVFKRKHIPMAVCSFPYPDMARLSRKERDYLEYNTHTFWQGRYFTFATYCSSIAVYNDRVRAFCEREGLLYIPLAEEMHGGLDCYGDIAHMRPKGIARKAEILSGLLKDYLESQLSNTNVIARPNGLTQ